MKAVIVYERHDYFAINGNFSGGRLPATRYQTTIGPHLSTDTITEVRHLGVAVVLILGYVYDRSRQN